MPVAAPPVINGLKPDLNKSPERNETPRATVRQIRPTEFTFTAAELKDLLGVDVVMTDATEKRMGVAGEAEERTYATPEDVMANGYYNHLTPGKTFYAVSKSSLGENVSVLLTGMGIKDYPEFYSNDYCGSTRTAALTRNKNPKTSDTNIIEGVFGKTRIYAVSSDEMRVEFALATGSRLPQTKADAESELKLIGEIINAIKPPKLLAPAV